MTGFNCDIALRDEFIKLIKQFAIKTIVETGTYKGDTTVELAALAENIVTIEINQTYFNESTYLTRFKNVTRILGASETVLHNILPTLKRPILFFLDAHWGVNPLLGELAAIGRHGLSDSVIVIHDFQVPNTDLGYDFYDKYNKCPINLQYIQSHVSQIYKGAFDYYYNDPARASGSRRGAIFITPKGK
jgi:hypothetical protein